MIDNPEIRKIFQEMTPIEQVYERYYRAKNEGRELESYVEQLKVEFKDADLNWNYFWFPDIHPLQKAKITQELKYPFRENIVVAKHMRFHPYFTHTHQFYEFIYVLDGSCTNIVADRTIEMKKHSLCILPPHVQHSVGVFSEDSVIVNICAKKNTFNAAYAKLFAADSPFSEFMRDTAEGTSKTACLYFPDTDLPGLRGIIEALILSENAPDDTRYDYKKSLLFSACALLYRMDRNSVVEVTSDAIQSNIISNIRNYLENNYASATLESTAAYFHYSAPYLSRLVHQKLGIPFSALQREVRLSRACELLSGTKMSIAEISNELGYETPIYFTRVFKKYTGLTPRVYRVNSKD